MGVVAGLVLGAGLALCWLAWWEPTGPGARTRDRRARRHDLVVQAGVPGLTPTVVGVAGAGAGVLAAVLTLGVAGSVVLACAFGALAACGPWQLVRSRAARRRRDRRELWPDAVDHLASGVRAGLSLPEAVSQLGERGPAALRAPFARFADDYRVTGRFGDCLDALKDRLADPVADRIVESLRITREVGGTDLGPLLRTVSALLRDDLRTRTELESRQSWTVAGARLACAAPWVVLALLATRPEAAAAYDSTAGAVVLGAGALCSVVAYRTMLRVGRLPEERRVLR
ncbi:type II secretion system protein F (GspF) [Sediminihabitans luteus]|uniref:Type II secretion system protein F (GspF) n=1 Tax=Sediminihabitans luteus TaxID=1138585 RepID=A0A2M9CYE6_9CELL|nr:type II secretion system F family protein [Sediminihabitans luteus]PJJ76930.1 type II secretion system protein F (GspF) [Sediminihabitans luteus]GII99571.1 hypothetical protein Slu03_19490 [Sediminihabitans luteus]